MSTACRIAIMMASFNGERFLAEQLRSITQQDHVHWDLWISDDGSEDRTLETLEAFSKGFSDFAILEAVTLPKKQLIFLLHGPRRGVAANFYHLVESVYQRALRHYDAFAFADQDDIWFSNKLSRAISALTADQHRLADGTAAALLWCSEVQLSNQRGELQGRAVTEIPGHFKPSLQHALTQNVIRGNTCVLNREAFELIHACRPRSTIVIHDWWFYLVIASSPKGMILHEAVPSLAYRQHEGNQVGEPSSLLSRVRRRRRAWQGEVRSWNDKHIIAVRHLHDHVRDRLVEELWPTIDLLEQVCVASRTKGLWERLLALRLLRKAKLRRLGWIQNLFMDLLVLTRRF